jgi:hypothetical protein
MGEANHVDFSPLIWAKDCHYLGSLKSVNIPQEPNTYEHVIVGPYKKEWELTMETKY